MLEYCSQGNLRSYLIDHEQDFKKSLKYVAEKGFLAPRKKDEREYNFTHRIDKFYFGKPHAGIVHPLEGDEKIADKCKCLCFWSYKKSVLAFVIIE